MNRIFSGLRRLSLLLLSLSLILALAPAAEASVYNYAYPDAAGKKGLYVAPGMEEDAAELGASNTTINIVLTDLIAPEKSSTESQAYAYSYGGRVYWFQKGTVAGYDSALTRLAQSGTVVTGILLIRRRADLMNLIYPSARSKTANFYAWNMSDPEAVNEIKAAVSFLQERYVHPGGPRIAGWIVGNEVNNSRDWNWGGQVSFQTYIDNYAKQVAAVREAAVSITSGARVYLSLDHYWNMGVSTYWYAGKKVLDAAAASLSRLGLGNGTWCIAYHPYNADLLNPSIVSKHWTVTGKTSTRIISMRNLKVLTRYVKKNFGRNCRVLLSEQGYSSVRSRKEQARSVALAYYIAQSDPMVDALIYHRQVDHLLEVKTGAAFGLYTTQGEENADTKKDSWYAYKYAGTTKKTKYNTYAAKWARKLTGSKAKRTIRLSTGKLKAAGSLALKQNLTEGARGFGALTGMGFQQGACILTHDGSRNANIPWGVIRDGTFSAKKNRKFVFSISVFGASNNRYKVLLQLYSGSKKIFEAGKGLRCGTAYLLSADLKLWKYRNRITSYKIQILPDGGTWMDVPAFAQIGPVGVRR